MTETIHIFDEFPQSSVTLSPEERHRKRMALEPLIYDILKAKYYKRFETYWQTTIIPKESSKALVMIERRIHPNLEFVIKNAAYYARGWSIVLICSDLNYTFLQECLGPQREFVHCIPYFKGNPPSQIGKEEYNSLLQTEQIWTMIHAETLCFLEVDTYLRKPIPEAMLQFDYVSAPYAWDESSVGGGFSIRNKSAMQTICQSFPTKMDAADSYIMKGVKELHKSTPPLEQAVEFVVESLFYEDPVAVHQWWTFFDTTIEDYEAIFKGLLRCEEI